MPTMKTLTINGTTYTLGGGLNNLVDGSSSGSIRGINTNATIGINAFAIGANTIAQGLDSCAEGFFALSSGDYSHSQNYRTIAAGECQTAIGSLNIEDSNDDYLFIIGNGDPNSASRSNALMVDWDGNLYLAGDLYDMEGNSLSSVLNGSY